MTVRVAVLTVSDRASSGVYEDITGPAVSSAINDWDGFDVVASGLVADELDEICAQLQGWVGQGVADVIFTNGGTGLGSRDVTPEATLQVIDRQLPGVEQLLRQHGLSETPLAALSRQVVGQVGKCLVVNLPGSPKGALQNLEVLPKVLQHAIAMVHDGGH